VLPNKRKKYVLLVEHNPKRPCAKCKIIKKHFPNVQIKPYTLVRAILGE